MIIFLFEIALLALSSGSQDTSSLTGAAAPVPARTELERLVLGPLNDREKVADWLEAHASDGAALRRSMDEIGFKELPASREGCRDYVYSRVVGNNQLTRWASVVWCKARPFVLLIAGFPNVSAPPPGSDAVSIPVPPRTQK